MLKCVLKNHKQEQKKKNKIEWTASPEHNNKAFNIRWLTPMQFG